MLLNDPEWQQAIIRRQEPPKLLVFLRAKLPAIEDAYSDPDVASVMGANPAAYCATPKRAFERQEEWLGAVGRLSGLICFTRETTVKQLFARKLVHDLRGPLRIFGCDLTEKVSAFLSYSTKDKEFVERLVAGLRAQNLRVWFAQDSQIADRFQESIEKAIRSHDKVIVVLSHASVQSPWVTREVNATREREDRENRRSLFPIRIDDTVVGASAPWVAEIRRTLTIGDFSRWKDHGFYKRAFERLVRDLTTDVSGTRQ